MFRGFPVRSGGRPRGPGGYGGPLLVAAVALATPPALPSGLNGVSTLLAQDAASSLGFDAVLRPGYHGAWRSDRDGTSSRTHEGRLRAQVGIRWAPGPEWELRARLAGRVSTEQEALRFYLRDHAPTTDGLRPGESTVDELYVGWRPTAGSRLRVGRMQTSFELAGVPRKSLDRNDSPNTEVSWTDGVHLSVPVGGWRHHLVVQRNGSRGPTNAIRSPLDVTGSGSPAALFVSLEAEDALGPLVQRQLDATFLPGVVPRPGENGDRGDYAAVVLRVAAEAKFSPFGGRPVVGLEGGVASGAPSRTVLGTGGPEDGAGDAWAFQVSGNLMGMAGGHSVGIVHAQAGDGWLISPDIRDNNRELEVRYYWHYAPWGRLDVRFRHREDMTARPDALRKRRDRDVYFRTTISF
jgi:hypothetical protein